MKKLRFEYTYDQYEDENKNAATMVSDILKNPEFPQADAIEIGSWGGAWEEDCQPLLDDLVKHADSFSHIKKLSIGIMDSEESELSWIMQGNYSRIWPAFPHLESITIQGSSELKLGTVQHDHLKELTILCGGLPISILDSIQNAKLPELEILRLYIGVEDYGFDGSIEDIKKFLEESDFPKLTYLGLLNSEIQDDVVKAAIESKYMKHIETLDLSCGTLTDTGGKLLLEAIPNYPNIQKLDLHYHYLTDSMMKKLEKLPIETDLSDQNEPEEYDSEIYYDAMFTE